MMRLSHTLLHELPRSHSSTAPYCPSHELSPFNCSTPYCTAVPAARRRPARLCRTNSLARNDTRYASSFTQRRRRNRRLMPPGLLETNRQTRGVRKAHRSILRKISS